jgi:UDP-N-acetylmuramoyl-L-alanyl-D-glutamate--2,6-diaminopimelate ligase
VIEARFISLHHLFENFPFDIFSPVPEVIVSRIVTDSRQVQRGDLFIALTGGTTDGHTHISEAIQRGAAAIVGMQALTNLELPYVRVTDSRRSLPYLAARFYNNPARKMTVIGVTGTDGKTTTSNLIFQILKTAGIKAGLISTVNAVIGNQIFDTGFHVTTPDPLQIQAYLDRMTSAGLSHVILEATSHGLAQYRVDACEFDYGVVTNITHEHLDYHGSYEVYRAAKARLFALVGETAKKEFPVNRAGILNRDDSSYEYLSGVTEVRQITYGQHPEADIRAEEINQTYKGLEFTAVGRDFRIPIKSSLVGDYNVSNCLAAFTTSVLGLGIPAHLAQQGIEALPGIPGRMEMIDLGQDFVAMVDFAHTPNALKAALSASRKLLSTHVQKGRLIAVFGSAGLRDRAKRKMMAEVSAELADITILTAEDPRTEPLETILAEMAGGVLEMGGLEGKSFWRIPDRGEALRFAVRLANPGDVVIVCGKGHEQSMCFGTEEYPWDDRTALKAALAELIHTEGPPMPYLPTQEAG